MYTLYAISRFGGMVPAKVSEDRTTAEEKAGETFFPPAVPYTRIT
jgi:hypothetical protein